MKRWFSTVGLAAALAAGVVGGLALAVLSNPHPAFSYNQVSIVSWRGGGDAVPADALTAGWSAPMFYTSAAEGAPDGGPPGLFPTGVWAPGDTVARILTVRNADSDHMMQLYSMEVRMDGDLELAPWLSLTVRDPADRILYEGRLSELAAGGFIPFAHPMTLRIGGQSDLTFTVSLSREIDQRHQGKSVQADFTLSARSATIPAIIDIHPNSWPNPINPGGHGSTPVAINGTDTLDVHTLNWSTARFGPGQAAPVRPAAFEDWNGDGREDMILHFGTQSTGITCGMTSATLTVASFAGEVYEGADAIVTPPCRK